MGGSRIKNGSCRRSTGIGSLSPNHLSPSSKRFKSQYHRLIISGEFPLSMLTCGISDVIAIRYEQNECRSALRRHRMPVTRWSLAVSSSGFLRETTGPESRRSGWSRSNSRSQIGTERCSLFFVTSGGRSITRLSHLKKSQVVRDISPSVRTPARPPRASHGRHSRRTAPRNASNSSGLNVATEVRFVSFLITSSGSVFRSRGSARNRA